VSRLLLAAHDGLAALAYPAYDTRWIAHDYRVRRNVARDDRAGPDHSASADAHGGNQRGLSADGRAVFHDGAVPPGRTRERSTRATDVGELGTRAHEDILAQHDSVPHARMALDARTGPDDRARGDEAKGANDDVRPEPGTIHYDGGWIRARRGSRS
jgi:hypothetical protein